MCRLWILCSSDWHAAEQQHCHWIFSNTNWKQSCVVSKKNVGHVWNYTHAETHAEDLVVAKVQNSKSVNLKDAECLRELLVHLNTGSKVFASREFWYWILFHKTKLFYCVFRCGFVGVFFGQKSCDLMLL